MAKSNHNELSFMLPSGWMDLSQIVAVGPVEGNFRPNLVVTREPVSPTETPKAFAERQLPLLRQAVPGLNVIKEGPAKFGNLSGFSREYTGALQGQRLQQYQLYVLNAGIAYVFTATHMEGRLDGVRAAIEGILATVALS